MTWALQPLPEEYVHNSTESNKRQAVSVKCKLQREQAQYDTNQVEAQTAQQDTAVGTAGTHTTPQTASTAAISTTNFCSHGTYHAYHNSRQTARAERAITQHNL
jgi:hypothetical protein